VTHVLGPGTVTEQFSRIGYVGVEFFFVLSGFVLTWSHDPHVSIQSFYIRRFARIYPLYIVTWVAVVAASHALGIEQSWIGALLGVILLQAWFPQQEIFQAGNTPGWSLSAEAFFYAAFPFIIRRIPNGGWVTVLTVAVITTGGLLYSVSSLYSVWFAYYSPIYGILYFIAGMVLARHARNRTLRVPSLRVSLLALVGSFVVLSAFAFEMPKGYNEALMLPSIVLVIAAAARSDLTSIPSMWAHPVATRLGQWSFALYLVHWGILGIVDKVRPDDFGAIGTLAGAIGFLCIATLTAAGAYYVIERPAERWVRGRWGGPQSPDPRAPMRP